MSGGQFEEQGAARGRAIYMACEPSVARCRSRLYFTSSSSELQLRLFKKQSRSVFLSAKAVSMLVTIEVELEAVECMSLPILLARWLDTSGSSHHLHEFPGHKTYESLCWRISLGWRQIFTRNTSPIQCDLLRKLTSLGYAGFCRTLRNVCSVLEWWHVFPERNPRGMDYLRDINTRR